MLKIECRLYIAYIETKGTEQKKGINIAFLMIRKTENTYKERNLYITYIGKERKRVQSRTQKGTKKGATK